MQTQYYMTTYSTSTEVSGASLALLLTLFIVWFIIAILMVISIWRLFIKAGKPGWAAIVPIYNIVVMLEISGKPMWWIAMLFIPFVNIVFGIMIYYSFVKAYGKSDGFAVLAIFFPYIMYPIMAFSSKTQFIGASGQQQASQVAGGQQSPFVTPVAPAVQQSNTLTDQGAQQQ